MRLINVSSLELEEHPENNVPAYVILSHTWGDEEVTYAEMQRPTPATRNKKGYIKIENFAKTVRSRPREIGHIWVDTCCINKQSSAELSESINSMYRYYKNAIWCYVHLTDVHLFEERPHSPDPRGPWYHHIFEVFRKCRWITRGWTLQELIAPRDVIFFSDDWNFLFKKHDCNDYLAMLLGIPPEVLLTGDPGQASVAQRMSWASDRDTTRSEDMAYCMLGIFDVSMPLLYGEGGEKAFIRLQEEIMKSSDDQSLFAWRIDHVDYAAYFGLLAVSPRGFKKSRNIVAVDNPEHDTPFSMTNKGLSLRMQMVRTTIEPAERGVYIGLLCCTDPGRDGKLVGLFLKQLSDKQYCRVDAHQLWHADQGTQAMREYAAPSQWFNRGRGHTSPWFGSQPPSEISALVDLYVRQNIRLPLQHVTPRVGGLLIHESILVPEYYLCNVSPGISWTSGPGFIGILPEEQSKKVVFSYNSCTNPQVGTLIVVLAWERRQFRFGARCHYTGSRTGEVADQLSLLNDVGSPCTWFDFETSSGKRTVNVDMQLVMQGRTVVIKVSIKFK